MQYLTKEELLNLDSKGAREFVDNSGDSLLGANKDKIAKIKNYFIDLLLEDELYQVFSFEEIVQFFLWESHLFYNNDKEKILQHLTDKFKQFCNSKNKMISFVLLDFISREIDKKLRKKYVYKIKEKYNDLNTKNYKRCLDIIENGFFDENRNKVD